MFGNLLNIIQDKMIIISGKNEYEFYKNLKLNLNEGNIVCSNNHEYFCKYSVLLNFSGKRKLLFHNKKLGSNYLAMLLEFLMVIGNFGKEIIDRLKVIKNFYPRNYSLNLDSFELRDGERIFDWHGINQLKTIVDILKKEKQTSRGILFFLDVKDTINVKSEYSQPCQHWWQFLYKNNMLYMNACFRSLSLEEGLFLINYFELNMFLRLVAKWLNVECGDLNVFVGQLVTKTQNSNYMKEALECESWKEKKDVRISDLDISIEYMQEDANNAIKFVQLDFSYKYRYLRERIRSKLIQEWVDLLHIAYLINNYKYEEAMNLYNRVEKDEFKLACATSYLRLLESNNKENSLLIQEILGVVKKDAEVFWENIG